MKDSLLALGSTLVMILAGSAAHANPTLPKNLSDEDTAYTRVITERAGKIVATLNLPDSATFYRVRTIVAGQYRALNAIYTDRDNRLKEIKDQQPPPDKNTIDSIKKIVQQDVDTRVTKLHGEYLAILAKVLDSNRIDKVKDGMTYNVREVTFNAYVQMIPQLTDEQKAVIMADLIEAREHAMDAESSEKKHAWFGKYKGRINNYLSSQGLNTKQTK
jgi:2,3-bisphosphoglycerate-independent phosphoglycerate mutase